MRRGLTRVFDSFKRIASEDAEFVRLGWRPGVFFLTYCRGWLRDRLFHPDVPGMKEFVVRHRVSGQLCRLHMRIDSGWGDWIVLRGVWIDEDYFHPLLNRCRTILDIGANIGMAAVWLGRMNPGAKFGCVEPDPRNVPLLRRNISANAIEATIFECAVAARRGRARLGLGANCGWSALENTGLHQHARFVEVETRRVPEILDHLGWSHVDLLKLDIEGLERDILADAGDWLSRVGLMVFELHPNTRPTEIGSLLGQVGWTMERIGYRGDPTYLASPLPQAPVSVPRLDATRTQS